MFKLGKIDGKSSTNQRIVTVFKRTGKSVQTTINQSWLNQSKIESIALKSLKGEKWVGLAFETNDPWWRNEEFLCHAIKQKWSNYS